MKKVSWWVSLVMLLAIFAPMAQAQQVAGSAFDGNWQGRITTPEGQEVDVRILIKGNTAQQFFNRDGNWSAVDPDKVTFMVDRNNAVMVWLNSGGAWSETQVYSLSLKNANKLDVVWTRHVNNIKDGADNETWNLLGSGTLRRSA